MLDQFGAVHSRNNESRRFSERTPSHVSWAIEFLFQKWTIYLPQLLTDRFVISSNDDPIGMEKIRDCRAFAQKLRIGRDPEIRTRFPAVHSEGTHQFLASLRGNRAFLDDELRTAAFGSDHARNTINRAQIGVAVFKRRSSHTNKDDFTGTDCLTGVRDEM